MHDQQCCELGFSGGGIWGNLSCLIFVIVYVCTKAFSGNKATKVEQCFSFSSHRDSWITFFPNGKHFIFRYHSGRLIGFDVWGLFGRLYFTVNLSGGVLPMRAHWLISSSLLWLVGESPEIFVALGILSFSFGVSCMCAEYCTTVRRLSVQSLVTIRRGTAVCLDFMKWSLNSFPWASCYLFYHNCCHQKTCHSSLEEFFSTYWEAIIS